MKAYSWRATHRPETPYRHAYHTSLVDKLRVATKANPRKGTSPETHYTFEQVLERIRLLDRITCGIPKILYLVGWQFDGHDSKYPSWAEVNERLKRSSDATAIDSLRWLMTEASQHHTTVSLHINMMDAYENSPLWPEYRAAGCIVDQGGVWGGEQAWRIDYAREWEAGLTRKRIDALVKALPLREAGTIHIDAFWPTGNPETSVPAMRRIVRYWRNLGIDVTTEGILPENIDDGLIGLSPMSWHMNFSRSDEFTDREYIEIPASLFCGGYDPSPWRLVFGTSMQGSKLSPDDWRDYMSRFCTQTLPWQYLNRHERLHCESDADGAESQFSDGVRCQADFKTEHIRIERGDLLVRDGGDLFVPCPWVSTRTIMAYSRKGHQIFQRTLPEEWGEHASVQVKKITPNGRADKTHVPVHNRSVQLPLEPGRAYIIQPVVSANTGKPAEACMP